MISISYSEGIEYIKIWNINNFECLLHLDSFDRFFCFIKEDNNIYICNISNEIINVFDLNRKIIKNLTKSRNDNFSLIPDISYYYDQKLTNNFFLANFGLSIKSYFYKAFKIYHLYNDKYSYNYRDFIILKENNGKLIASNEDGNIRV